MMQAENISNPTQWTEANGNERMSETAKPTKNEIAAGIVLLSALVLAYFWSDIRKSDLYQRNFNTAQWEKKQHERAERLARHAELDRMECYIMLRAKADLVPIEIERSTLFGMSKENATKMATDEFELDKKLCEERGIVARSGANPNARDDCERHPGIYGC